MSPEYAVALSFSVSPPGFVTRILTYLTMVPLFMVSMRSLFSSTLPGMVSPVSPISTATSWPMESASASVLKNASLTVMALSLYNSAISLLP